MKKILIVEDNLILRENLTELLEIKGFSATNACNGKQALKLLMDDEPDLILSDYDMPEVNGLDLLEEINVSEKLSKTPFVMMTGNAHPDLKARATTLGVKAFLYKPFRLCDLDSWLMEQMEQ